MFPYSYYTRTNSSNEPTVEISIARLNELLQPIISQIEVDETWYRRSNPDVDAAIRAGSFKTASEHYKNAGYFENRLPRAAQIDENWYLNEYSDVANAITRGIFASAADHFQIAGFKEGRKPNATWSLAKPASKR